MTPIAKNILVVDESGKAYTSTYAKRAQGLVKKGRARWLDEQTICLACPPDLLNLEDTEMENMQDMNIVQAEQAQEGQKAQDVQKEIKGASHAEFMAGVLENIGKFAPQAQSEPAAITAREILDRIDKIIAQGDELKQVVEQIHDLPVNESPEGGLDGGYRAQAIDSIYTERERTNQKAIALLKRMYEDIAPKQTADPQAYRLAILEAVGKVDYDTVSGEVCKNLLDFYQRQLDNL